MVVNVASYCGYTDEHYKELVKLQNELPKDEFNVLAFPCNQFGEQEPLSNDAIAQWAAEEYKVNFPIFAKIEVAGREKHAAYKSLMSKFFLYC